MVLYWSFKSSEQYAVVIHNLLLEYVYDYDLLILKINLSMWQ